MNTIKTSDISLIKHDKNIYINREISWLSFNARVLQEANDPSVPLIERIKFLSIFSSNLDEFFRVRVATLRRMMTLGKKAKTYIGDNPKDILTNIQKIVIRQSKKFEETYQNIQKELGNNKIFIINESELSEEEGDFVNLYFLHEVRPTLMPIMVSQVREIPPLKDEAIYLAADLLKNNNENECAIIEVPTDVLSRFLVLPSKNGNKRIILLDDVIRYNLKDIFMTFDVVKCDAYTIKLTRDAELDIDNDILQSFVDKIADSLKKRKIGSPVRFIYDSQMSDHLLNLLKEKLNIKKNDNIIPGGRYHNFKDFIKFPFLGLPELRYKPVVPLQNRNVNPRKSLLQTLKKKDIFLHYPYQSYHYIIDLLREASIDPDVISIKITLYRVAKKSNVINALINAVKNGKNVTVFMELQARFDEEANIYWTKRLGEEGANVITGALGIKIHSKLCLITKQEKGKTFNYAHIGTGNFNEETARLYCDDSLLTTEKRITEEVKKLFTFIESNYKYFEEDPKKKKFKHLLVSPFNMRNKLYNLIDREIKNAKAGKEAYCLLKMNSLSDIEIIDKLYEASQAGVKIKLIVRGICSLIPGIPELSENINAISILDKYLEHSRVFIFCHGGKEKYYISSADLMTRNLNYRVEVACPVYDKELQKEIRNIIDIQLSDNVKARIWNKRLTNKYKRKMPGKEIRGQIEIYNYLKEKAVDSE